MKYELFNFNTASFKYFLRLSKFRLQFFIFLLKVLYFYHNFFSSIKMFFLSSVNAFLSRHNAPIFIRLPTTNMVVRELIFKTNLLVNFIEIQVKPIWNLHLGRKKSIYVVFHVTKSCANTYNLRTRTGRTDDLLLPMPVEKAM